MVLIINTFNLFYCFCVFSMDIHLILAPALPLLVPLKLFKEMKTKLVKLSLMRWPSGLKVYSIALLLSGLVVLSVGVATRSAFIFGLGCCSVYAGLLVHCFNRAASTDRKNDAVRYERFTSNNSAQ